MKVAAIIAATFIVPSESWASEKRVAIIVQGDESTSPADLRRFEAKLDGGILRKRATLVSRNRLSAVLQEQGLSNSLYADPSTAASLGRIIGASYILLASLALDVEDDNGAFVDRETVSATADFNLISVSTARILSAGTADGDGDAESAAGGQVSGRERLRRDAIDSCAGDLISQVDL